VIAKLELEHVEQEHKNDQESKVIDEGKIENTKSMEYYEDEETLKWRLK